jgi:hypothetical protein
MGKKELLEEETLEKETEEVQENQDLEEDSIKDVEEEESSEEPEEEPEGEPDEEPKPKRFELEEEPEPEEELIDLVHNGQVIQVTQDKLIKLAQKGFDYDYKVGPHGKIVEMIEADPEIASLVNEHWQKKTTPKFTPKPLSEYEDEGQWLIDNVKGMLESAPRQEPVPKAENDNHRVKDALTMRDPDYADKVIRAMPQYVKRLSISDYQRIDSDMGALCKFYDFVKESEGFGQSEAPPPPTKKPGFRVRSGGQRAAPSKADLVWIKSRADFQAELDRVKGY